MKQRIFEWCWSTQKCYFPFDHSWDWELELYWPYLSIWWKISISTLSISRHHHLFTDCKTDTTNAKSIQLRYWRKLKWVPSIVIIQLIVKRFSTLLHFVLLFCQQYEACSTPQMSATVQCSKRISTSVNNEKFILQLTLFIYIKS